MFNFLKQKPKTLGQIGEDIAQREYKKRGYTVVAANFFNKKGLRKGEIDVIVKNKKELIFVEVKTRVEDNGYFGTAAESVNVFKQAKLLKAVKQFLVQNPGLTELKPQIDVCVIIMNTPSQLVVAETKPVKYLVPGGLDKLAYSVTIVANAVEDWN